MQEVKFWKMTTLGCKFNIIFDQTLAPGSSLCNTLKTKLHAWTESSIIVEFMVKFIWQHNLPVRSYHTFKMPPGRLDFMVLKGQKMTPPPLPVTSKLKVREVSQSGFWNTVPHDTQLLCQVSAKSVDHNFWPLEHFLRQWHLRAASLKAFHSISDATKLLPYIFIINVSIYPNNEIACS